MVSHERRAFIRTEAEKVLAKVPEIEGMGDKMPSIFAQLIKTQNALIRQLAEYVLELTAEGAIEKIGLFKRIYRVLFG